MNAVRLSWLNTYRGLSHDRILTLLDTLPLDMPSNLEHVVQVASERGLLERYGGLMPPERLAVALKYVKDPEKLARLQAVAREQTAGIR